MTIVYGWYSLSFSAEVFFFTFFFFAFKCSGLIVWEFPVQASCVRGANGVCQTCIMQTMQMMSGFVEGRHNRKALWDWNINILIVSSWSVFWPCLTLEQFLNGVGGSGGSRSINVQWAKLPWGPLPAPPAPSQVLQVWGFKDKLMSHGI